jgi:uncharacterized protein YfaS (alpha-2-macroglobulin family)
MKEQLLILRTHKWLLAGLLCLVALAAYGCSTPLTGVQGNESGSKEPGVSGEPQEKTASTYTPATEIESKKMSEMWSRIEEFIDEQKYRQALELAEEMLESLRGSADTDNWTRALIQVVQLETGLHGYEGAAVRLRDEPWPNESMAQTTLHLFYAQGLTTYLSAYSWEIGERELVASDSDLDLKSWTGDQIFAEAQRAYSELWSTRSELGERNISELSRYLDANDYPAGIRDTLRDAVTYLWVELLADTSRWSPKENNESFLLDLRALVEGGADGPADAGQQQAHPLERIALILGDLEGWHNAAGRQEAALEARLERLRRLQSSFSGDGDIALLRSELEEILLIFDDQLPWWSVAAAELADLIQKGRDPWRLVAARDVALRGLAAHPDSYGGQRCRAVLASIEAPGYAIENMSTDGLDRRSIQISHRNLESLYFRAYPVDLMRQIETSDDYSLLPGRQEIEKIVAKRNPAFSWTSDLEATPDFRQHKTFMTPEIDTPGLYLVVASADRRFSASDTLLQAIYLNLSDLVLVVRRDSQSFDVTVRSGGTGRVVPGADVTLYRYDYSRRGHQQVDQLKTDAEGRARFVDGRTDSNYFLVATADDQIAFDPAARSWPRGQKEKDRRRALVYTDRSIYRPGQEILWKAVAYRGKRSTGSFETLPRSSFSVDLIDANGETVETEEVVSNLFGSASGRFEVPKGRLLGGWRVRASLGGGAQVQVEEYKRPTFTVELLEAKEALRLNKQAPIHGEAQYYFGLPLVDGEVRWSVTREPVFPRWWSWWYRSPPSSSAQMVASGTAQLDSDGRFSFEFLPVADERKADSGVSYRYRTTVEVTDIGGETRSAEKSFRLGFVAVEATLTSDSGFVLANETASYSVRRTNLDGAPRSGSGVWRLVSLEQPEQTLLPADLPFPEAPAGASERPEHRTAGDRLRPRWAAVTDSAPYLRSWNDGAEIVRGDSLHGENGQAEIRLPQLNPGAYRLYYSTEDELGAEFATQREFAVVDPGASTLAVPLVLWVRASSVPVGETAQFLVHSGLEDQDLILELFHRDRVLVRKVIRSNAGPQLVDLEIGPEHRGGIGARLTGIRDHQLLAASLSTLVPWDDRRLDVSFSTFRDRIRPGETERWDVTVTAEDGESLEQGSAELLAYMYDRSLDLFASHRPTDPLGLYPSWGRPSNVEASLGSNHPQWRAGRLFEPTRQPHLRTDRLKFLERYGIGGMGRRRMMRVAMAAPMTEMVADSVMEAVEAEPAQLPSARMQAKGDLDAEEEITVSAEQGPEAPDLRSDFSETAFWRPHLRLDEDGSVSFEFTVPDSLTEWNVWVHALTRDLRAGRVERRSVSSKELMVRPYLPRFLREGDQIQIQVVVNNAGDSDFEGVFDLALEDRDSGLDIASDFGLSRAEITGVPFRVAAGGGETFPFLLEVPARLGEVAVRVEARAGEWRDGELRALPLLPGRMHLIQSRFAALQDVDRRQLRFADMVGDDDPSLLHEQLVVTLDGQLFYGVLNALPYLANYPYECTEQTLNRFVSTGIVSTLYDRYPAVKRMAKEFSERETQLESWDLEDPNRAMALVETPWLMSSRGGSDSAEHLINVLDPKIALQQRRAALAKLEKAQTASGGFPWWPGGPPSPHMTLYLLSGLSRALEFDVEVPRPMVTNAWRYLERHYVDEIAGHMVDEGCCWELVTFLNYVLSSYPDESWTGGVFSAKDRKTMLDYSFGHWKEHSPLLKGYLTLTLKRAGRSDDADLVFDSVMDSARTEPDLGTYWAPEDRAWLWYNDTIESHAFALRVLSELRPADERRQGLVHWLFLNKKLNHWKSTRATAEVIYALVHYLDAEGTLGSREAVDVTIGNRPAETFVFEPDEYTGDNVQLVLAGEEIEGATDGTIVVEKETPGLLFASATWHFSTEKLPEAASGDFFSVERRYFRRSLQGDKWTLEPMAGGARLEPGDQVEVQLSIRARHASEYVHLRDPRPSGFEPETVRSGYSWKLGLPVYEETRDSGTNFFFERLPVGEYTLKYRLRTVLSGTFKAAPAQLQSMYAPEFAAYSAGTLLQVEN